MPRASSVTKDMIIDSAFEIIRNEGFASLSARNIAKKIGCSTQPIYWVYENMEEIKHDVVTKIVAYLNNKIGSFHKTGRPFLDFGIGYIHTAYSEPKLFKLLYFDNIMNLKFSDITPGAEMIAVMRADDLASNMSDEELYEIAVKSWIFANGLAFLHAAGMMVYDEEKLEKMLSDFMLKL